MNYKEAVELAKAGDDRGYDFLYRNTYKSKLFLASKYTNTPEDAEDIMQEAYIRAFSKLDTLDSPENFPAWFGVIVANTAKNALKKKNPLSFSEIADDAQWDDLELQIEDTSVAIQPELSYTEKETVELVHEMLDTLPSEQKMCLLMFHIECQSISQIAETLGCSENTVKSRLNYGRKNVKKKGEELQKKGYTLYNIAPLPLLLYLLRKQLAELEGTPIPTGKTNPTKEVPQSKTPSASSEPVVNAVKKPLLSGLRNTVAGKVAAAGLAVCVLGGTVGTMIVSSRQEEASVPSTQTTEYFSSTIPESTTLETEAVTNPTTEPPADANVLTLVADDQFPTLLSGGLTKAQFAYLLDCLPGEISEEGLTLDELCQVVALVANTAFDGTEKTPDIQQQEPSWEGKFNLSDFNRYLSVITGHSLSESDMGSLSHGISVSGDTLTVSLVTMPKRQSVTVLNARVGGGEMVVDFCTTKTKEDIAFGVISYERQAFTATLLQTSEGTYRLSQVTPLNLENSGCKSMYQHILQQVNSGSYTFGFPALYRSENEAQYEYTLYDLSGDGFPELLVRSIVPETGMNYWRIFQYRDTPEGDGVDMLMDYSMSDPMIAMQEGTALTGGLRSGVSIPADGNGLFYTEVWSLQPEYSVYRVTIENGRVVKTKAGVLRLDEAVKPEHLQSAGALEWMPVWDYAALDELDENRGI